MRLSIECLPCLLGQAVRLARSHIENEELQRKLIKRVTNELSNLEDSVSAPYAAYKTQMILKDILQNPDPYQKEKQYYNAEMLKLENRFDKLITSAEDQLSTGLRLAAAGNIIDFGPGYDLSREKVLQVIQQTMDKEFPLEVFDNLKAGLQRGRSLLYLGDNAGEIVLDKLFIRTIKEHYPHMEIIFATRGEAVLNDITEEDACLVGMQTYARIINNGSGIPGTVLEYCSPEFQDTFHDSDLVIAKGQGNFESLHGCKKDGLYYLFLCKCDILLERFGAMKSDIILRAE